MWVAASQAKQAASSSASSLPFPIYGRIHRNCSAPRDCHGSPSLAISAPQHHRHVSRSRLDHHHATTNKNFFPAPPPMIRCGNLTTPTSFHPVVASFDLSRKIVQEATRHSPNLPLLLLKSCSSYRCELPGTITRLAPTRLLKRGEFFFFCVSGLAWLGLLQLNRASEED